MIKPTLKWILKVFIAFLLFLTAGIILLTSSPNKEELSKPTVPLNTTAKPQQKISTTVPEKIAEQIKTEKEFLDNPYVTIGEIKIYVELAITDEEIQKGLSNRISLDENKGMLFIFTEPRIYRFWMRGMQFPLDMIWINGDTIVDITKNIPANFDHENPILYSPSQPAQYVLEVNAGFTETNNIDIGNKIIFDIIKD